MLHELKPFHCPFCNNCFSSRDYGRHHNISNFPLLLKCGHSVCESCARNSAHRHKKIICLECQLPTDLSEGDIAVSSLLPDVYVLGVLSANMKRSLPSLKMKMQTLGQAYDAKRRHKQNCTPTVCDECINREACWTCEKCEESFCSICFDHVHSKGVKSMQKHEKKPIQRTLHNSMIQKSCEDHSNRDLEFFCDEDRELACSYCCVTGKHKGHNVLTLRQKNVSCQAELKSAYEAALQVKRRLKLSEKKLSDVIPALKTDNTPEINKIHNYFHTLHAALQLREHELIEQVKEINSAKTVPMEKMCQQLKEYQQSLDDLILDAEKTLRDTSVVINTPALIQKLEDCRNLPQHLISIPCDESCGMDIHFDEVDVLPLFKSIGKISADVQELYELKSPSDLPKDYILEPVFDMASITTETESVRSEVCSEDSLHSLLTPLSGRFDASDVDDFKYRPFAMSPADRVIVSHIRDPGKFWVQKCSESRKLKTMSDAINKWCRSADSSKHMPSHIIKGDLYLVQYSGDNKWYRARVKQIYAGTPENEKNLTAVEADDLTEEQCSELTELDLDDITKKKNVKVNVLYVDYGNTEIVPVGRLKNIQTRFLNVPGMAKECCLYDIFPVREHSWSPEAIKVFARFVGNKEVTMLISEERNGVLYVDLCQAAVSDITNDVPVSVRDALVFLEYGQFTDPKCVPSAFTQKNVRQFIPSDKLPADSKCNVILSHIENPSLFYVQQVATAGNLSNLITDMNMTYRSDPGNTLYQVYVPYVGMVCAAQYTVDRQWYRAEVLSLPGGAMVEVQYVDFGNKEVLHNRFLRKLFDRFLKLGKQAIACSFAEAKPATEEGWTPEAKNWMMKMAYKKQLYLKSLGIITDDDKASVILFEVREDSALCLNALMMEEGLAESSGLGLPKIFEMQDFPLRTASTQKNADVSETSIQIKEFKLPYDSSKVPASKASILAKRNYNENFVRVVVSHIETPGLFYLQLGTKIQEDLKKMMEDMQLIYKGSDSVLKEVIVGGMHAVFNEKDNKWYRGSVLEVGNSVAKVLFLDYGFVRDVGVENIRTLAEHLCVEDAFCHRCHLSDIEPAGGNKQWPTVSVEAFREVVTSGLSAYFIRKDLHEERSSLEAELYIEVLRRGGALEPSVFEYINVAEVLIERGIVLPVRKKSEHAVPKSPCDSEAIIDVPKVGSQSPQSSSPIPSASSSEVTWSHKTIHIPNKPTVGWVPYEPPASKNFNAIVTYVDENGSIFLHDKEKGACTIDIIKKAMSCKYSKAEHPKIHIPPPVGQACIAKFSVDKEWYRAEIVSTKPDSVKVLFVDYGNIENASLSDICLDVIMTDTPAQAVECQLSGIEPATPDKKWPNDILDFLHLAIVEQDCVVSVDAPPESGKPVQISLTLGGIDVRQVLLQMGCAVATNSSSPVHSKLNDLPSESHAKAVKKDAPIFSTFKKANPLREGEPFQVCVTQLLEPNFVFLQQLKIDEPASDYDKMRNVELENFLGLMKELADQTDSMPSVEKPELGVPYCAKYSYDNSWYRCEVTDISGEDISVLYVDYGNSEVIPVERLRKLPGCFVDFPVQSHFCKLHNVEPISEDGWSPEVVTAMVDSLFHCSSTLHARVINPGEVCEVELLIKNDSGKDGEWELAYQKLIDANLIKLEML